jgi:hypothetical protein
MAALTVENFIEHFRKSTGWLVDPGTRIERDLAAFAEERIGSKRSKDELHVIFCMTHGIKPFCGAGQPASKAAPQVEGEGSREE